jgi:hypothetical protein
MHDFEGIAYNIVFTLKCSETCKNWVINTLHQHNLIKRIVILNKIFVSLIPACNCFLWNFNYLRGVNIDNILLLLSVCVYFIIFLVFIIFFLLVHKIRQELRAETHCVLSTMIILIILVVFLEKYCESRKSVKTLWTEILEVIAMCNLIQMVLLRVDNFFL